MKRRACFAFCVLVCVAGLARAAGPFRFPEGKHGKGELKYISGVPVLVHAGTPEEMGEQMAVLGLKPAAPAVGVK
jgi:hypothetical protein